MPWNDGLEGLPLEIAGSDSLNIRIMAGPGTGKTYSLKKRVTRFLEDGITPNRILVVTFTRVAARDLVNELHSIGIEGCEHLVIGTLHSFCLNMLLSRDILPLLGRVPRPLMYFQKSGLMQFEGKALLYDIEREEFGDKRSCTRRIKAFEAAWARMQSDMPGWPIDATDREFQEDLIRWLRFHEAILIGELIPISLSYLRSNPMSPDRNRFDHVIVDEYQDLNRAEQLLIDLLAERSSLFIVGDVNQSIYSFRHANPEGIIEYNIRHPYPTDLPLVECRRCPRGIVRLANSLIQNNYRTPNDIILNEYPENQYGNINLIQWEDNESEARGISEYISTMIGRTEFNPEDVLILCPRRELGIEIKQNLQSLGINSHSFYHEEILVNLEAQISFTILSLLINHQDRVALRFYLGCESKTFLSRQYNILMNYCIENGVSPFNALQSVVHNEIEINGIKNLEKRFRSLIDVIDSYNGEPVGVVIDSLFPSDNPAYSPIRNIIGLENEAGVIGELSDFHQVLLTHINQPEVPSDIDYVRIMSLHKSKGLTSRVVIITSCVED